MTLPSVSYGDVAKELIRSLRGPVSQRDLSRQLGYSFNQVGKWETGFKQIKWPDFLKLAQFTGIPIEKHFREYFWRLDKDFDEWSTLDCIEDSVHLFLTQMKISKWTKRKWATKKAAPDLAEVLKMVDQRPWLLNGWLALFPGGEELPSLKERYALYNARLAAVFSDPISVYINAALQVKEYQELEFHSDELLAEHTTCSVERLRVCLRDLLSAEIISFDGKKYHPCPYDFSFSSQPHQKLRSLTKYSTDLASSRYSTLPSRALKNRVHNHSSSSVRVTALSADAARKVGELVTLFHSEVADIVAKDAGEKQNVQVILLHSFASNLNRSEQSAAKATDDACAENQGVRRPFDPETTPK